MIAALAVLAMQAQAGVPAVPPSSRDAEALATSMPTCAIPLGSISVEDEARSSGGRSGSDILRDLVTRSGCFTLVERGRGLNAVSHNPSAPAGGGGGQVPEYRLMFHERSPLDGMLAGIVNRSDNTLALVNVRTTETQAVVTVRLAPSAGAMGLPRPGAARPPQRRVGYADDQLGRVVTLAYADAYRRVVEQARVLPVPAVLTRRAALLSRGEAGAAALRMLAAGASVTVVDRTGPAFWRVETGPDLKGWLPVPLLRLVRQ